MRSGGPGRAAGAWGRWEAEGNRASLRAPLRPVRAEEGRNAGVLGTRKARCRTAGLREGVGESRHGAERRRREQVELVAAGLCWQDEAFACWWGELRARRAGVPAVRVKL